MNCALLLAQLCEVLSLQVYKKLLLESLSIRICF
ncbi:hypothetical protein PT2222_180097 [Paraburkholderia tropica]